jgi:hypothetical protein
MKNTSCPGKRVKINASIKTQKSQKKNNHAKFHIYCIRQPTPSPLPAAESTFILKANGK